MAAVIKCGFTLGTDDGTIVDGLGPTQAPAWKTEKAEGPCAPGSSLNPMTTGNASGHEGMEADEGSLRFRLVTRC